MSPTKSYTLDQLLAHFCYIDVINEVRCESCTAANSLYQSMQQLMQLSTAPKNKFNINVADNIRINSVEPKWWTTLVANEVSWLLLQSTMSSYSVRWITVRSYCTIQSRFEPLNLTTTC